MAGSILAGWAMDSGRYRPRRWVRASCWAVTQTDSGGSGTGAGRGRLNGQSEGRVPGAG